MVDAPGSRAALRRGVLAVQVLRDIDLQPADDGVVLGAATPLAAPVTVGWDECGEALDGADPGTREGADRLARWLLARRRLAGLSSEEAAAAVRPLGVPAGHPRHPGARWVREHVLGGALDLGLGILGLDPAAPEVVGPLLPGPVAAAGLPAADWEQAARDRLEASGAVAAERWRRSPSSPLRPVGDCDVVTLLGARSLRAVLAAAYDGMCTAAVPMRTRGWTELRRIDPAFAVAAASATEEDERGFARPLLVTADELTVVPPGGRPATIELRDGVAAQPWVRSVPYR